MAIKKIKLEVSILIRLNCDQVQQEGVPSTAIREISLLREIEHPNVVNLIDVICTNDKLYLIFEYAQKDLKKFMEKYPH